MNTPDYSEQFDSLIDSALEWLSDHGELLFGAANAVLNRLYNGVLWCIAYPSYYVIALIIAVIGWRVIGVRFAVLAALALMFCALIGLWPETVSTLALVLTATVLALVVGIPLGVLAGLAPAFDRVVDPCLDLVQTMPPYIYLLPAIALLGYGPATALLATFIVALPPAMRLTSLGIRMTPNEFIELGNASGVTGLQMFFKIRLPFAMPSIMAGVNQSLMMAFGMVVIAGIVGSGGLGQAIYGAVRTLDIAKSINAAIAIVILTMILDRLAQAAARARAGDSQ
ncbi:ABC-type proline/glycine betaine transport system [Pseudomonas caricapapayae]|uniref:ABC-type proline/glycine betaine transport system n=1 Tax=Pseudomonas caricapapayae TaxID=46678 RepID=A0A3M6FC32_9PSED|nr:ABC transporter permease subunit [Pseudomonas caricapapayae]RMV78211.1 ABC-type proline/glycine betaine transport system [Pseudomonas caricapapayae]